MVVRCINRSMMNSLANGWFYFTKPASGCTDASAD
jgi:hypothetical protein